MAARTTTRTGKERQGASEVAYYVYCIGEGDALGDLMRGSLPTAIEGDAGPEIVRADHLAAVVSAVPLEEYQEDALRERLADPAWTAVRAMRHERIIEFFGVQTSVIPLRFGSIYLNRERIAEMLGDRAAELRSIIERLRDREEWGVNVFRDREKLAEAIVSLSPRLRELADRLAAATPGQAYLLKKKIDATRVEEARAETRRVVADVEHSLEPFSEGVRRLRVLKDEATEHGEVAAKLAFLVARPRFQEFHAAAERLAEGQAACGFKLELTGPWPAYNFTSE